MLEKREALIQFNNVSFKYPGASKKALDDINLSINSSEYVVICGASGSGKSTLINHMKKTHIPFGEGYGDILFEGEKIEEADDLKQAARIGFITQDFDGQNVTDKVWHEIAFGLENLHMKREDIHRRVAEISHYFGLENIFHKRCDELSGGEKQLVSLASVMAMKPEVLILDEPTTQLDPVLSKNFLNIVEQIHKEFGVTIIIAEQRLEKVFSYAD
ncbi:MAG: energy-coupling factor ABC transporter ATP-binding protein, partial [Lachnospiraceae bacterium]|nr:energy-coupling factor ABC transporter ATP-binding protein [Lachnospiraceae bacterium]